MENTNLNKKNAKVKNNVIKDNKKEEKNITKPVEEEVVLMPKISETVNKEKKNEVLGNKEPQKEVNKPCNCKKDKTMQVSYEQMVGYIWNGYSYGDE
jgi:hypothetical protein